MLVSRGEVECPSCRGVYLVAAQGESPCPSEGCSWSTEPGEYRASIRNHHAHTGRAVEAFVRFYERYPAARTYSDKILIIDELVHAFHLDETRHPVKSVASKLLEGNKTEAVRFLDRLSVVDPARKQEWRRAAAHTIRARMLAPPDEKG